MSVFERTTKQFEELSSVALEALPQMVRPDGLFAHKTTVENGAYVNQRPNVLYTTDSLIGILSQNRRPADEVLPLGRAMDAAVAACAARGNADEVANMVWACTLAEDPRGEALLEQLCGLDYRRHPGGDLGFILYALSVGAARYPARRDRAMALAREVAADLLGRFRPGPDVFTGTPPLRRPPRRELLEARFSSFAGQVYPLHGLAAYYLYTGETPAPAVKAVAERIVEAQGSLGQWWWIYSTEARTVIEGYPVYSVHQDGMAFLGLLELEKLGIGGYREALALGVDWELGANELGTSLVSHEPASIARCIQRRGSDADGTYGLSKANLVQLFPRSLAPRRAGDRTGATPEKLEMLMECRSYHLGWLLYADSLVQAALARDAKDGA